MPRFPTTWRLVVAWACLNAMGCASGRYTFGKLDQPTSGGPGARVVTRGGPAPRLDRVERFLEWPSKLAFIPDPPPDVPSDETLAVLDRYLDQNGIQDVHIAIDEYSPSSQWSRLKENRQLSGFWRYPVGTLSCAFSALLPDRVLDRTVYNPYTNTLVINSDEPAELLAAAAYAKEVRRRTWRGPYVMLAYVPMLSMVHTVGTTNDVLSYARHEDDWELERSAYEELYPRLGAEGAMAVFTVPAFYMRPLVMMGGGLVGRSVAEVQIRRVAKQRGLTTPSLSPVDEEPELLAVEPPSLSRVTPVDAAFADGDDGQRLVFPEQLEAP